MNLVEMDSNLRNLRPLERTLLFLEDGADVDMWARSMEYS